LCNTIDSQEISEAKAKSRCDVGRNLIAGPNYK